MAYTYPSPNLYILNYYRSNQHHALTCISTQCCHRVETANEDLHLNVAHIGDGVVNVAQ